MGDRDVEVGPTSLDTLGEVVGADEVGARLGGLSGGIALGEDRDRDVLAEALRQSERPAQLLLRVADIDAEADMQLDRLVELGAGRLFDQMDRLRGWIRLRAIDLLVGLSISLAASHP
jgi:hypothetical protein